MPVCRESELDESEVHGLEGGLFFECHHPAHSGSALSTTLVKIWGGNIARPFGQDVTTKSVPETLPQMQAAYNAVAVCDRYRVPTAIETLAGGR